MYFSLGVFILFLVLEELVYFICFIFIDLHIELFVAFHYYTFNMCRVSTDTPLLFLILVICVFSLCLSCWSFYVILLFWFHSYSLLFFCYVIDFCFFIVSCLLCDLELFCSSFSNWLRWKPMLLIWECPYFFKHFSTSHFNIFVSWFQHLCLVVFYLASWDFLSSLYK